MVLKSSPIPGTAFSCLAYGEIPNLAAMAEKRWTAANANERGVPVYDFMAADFQICCLVSG
ncbi:hypothetical protein E5329_22475 [Petralouisia muris]|uniref:Uncharacterized protein n=1 Tax=Petralouisia muris TaxID=3032872 RepID=A0AC61RQN7_9FIRM|nr:hypothetical protein [Petralouisia muris]TGY91182.1 hypothetical protein E5329_22475 [Petralouisia muris]